MITWNKTEEINSNLSFTAVRQSNCVCGFKQEQKCIHIIVEKQLLHKCLWCYTDLYSKLLLEHLHVSQFPELQAPQKRF